MSTDEALLIPVEEVQPGDRISFGGVMLTTSGTFPIGGQVFLYVGDNDSRQDNEATVSLYFLTGTQIAVHRPIPDADLVEVASAGYVKAARESGGLMSMETSRSRMPIVIAAIRAAGYRIERES